MEWSVFFPRDSRRKRERSVRSFVAAINARQWEEAAGFLVPDIEVSDLGGSSITGQDDLFERERLYQAAYDNPQIDISLLSDNGGEVLMRGQIDSRYEDVAGPTFWRILFRDGLISKIEVMREGGLLTLPRFHPIAESLRVTTPRTI